MQPIKMLSNGVAVELLEDLRAHVKSLQPPEEEAAALLCSLHNCAGVCGLALLYY
jgi:hypothetical protein